MYYIGVDLGGTTIKVGLVDETHHIIDHTTLPTQSERPAEAVIQDMAKMCQTLIEKHQLKLEEIKAIGIGCPGLVNAEEGIVLSSSNLNFKEVKVRELFKTYFNIPVYIENDANCAALGEALAGAAKGARSALVITFGTGVGGGLILDGKIYTGAYFGAGEIGHQVINIHEVERCGCGRRGCYEQYASARALVKRAEEAAKCHEESLLRELVKKSDSGKMNGKIIFEAAHQGDATALEVLEEYYHYIACGAANLINIIEPEILVLGGGISGQGEFITLPITRHIKEEVYGGLSLKTAIKAAKLGNDAGIIGAALLGVSQTT